MDWQDIDGYFDFADVYAEQVRRAAPGAVFVEVGVYKGRSFAFLADAIRASGKSIKLYGVDHFKNGLRAELDANLTGCGVADLVTIIDGDSAGSAALFADRSVDFCYIDGDHSYEGVRRDIAAWKPKIRLGGTIAGHDRIRPPVDRAVREAFPGFARIGPLSWVVQL